MNFRAVRRSLRLIGNIRFKFNELGKRVFFEKKNQKTFGLVGVGQANTHGDKVFLLLFVHKKKADTLALLAGCGLLLLSGCGLLLLSGCAGAFDPYQRPGTWSATGAANENIALQAADKQDLLIGQSSPTSNGVAGAAAVDKALGGAAGTAAGLQIPPPTLSTSPGG